MVSIEVLYSLVVGVENKNIKTMLSPRQTAVLDQALILFGEKGEEHKQAIINKIKTTYEIEYVDYNEGMIVDLLNDVIFNKADNNLFTRYIVPPFSVLDTKNGRWLERRNLIDAYLGDSLAGRAEGLAYGNIGKRKENFKQQGRKMTAGTVRALVGAVRANDNGTSQFDSVLAELLLKWFGFPTCTVLDPFAGGITRGGLASLLGYRYTGFELRQEQVDANIARANELGLSNINWVCDDALNLEKHFTEEADLVFTCPPYGDLEQYSDDPRDLSNMEYTQFLKAYNQIIKMACNKLKPNRFAVIVVGDFRDEKGFYRCFVADTVKAFKDTGLELYNDVVLLNALGSASMRASNMFASNRKMVKVHQNVLVFYKGDPRAIGGIYGDIDSSLPIKMGKQETLF